MWLLSTDRAELHHFARNFDATGGYAILSHTWGGYEQTFQELRAITERCRPEALNPRDFVSEKIRNCCLLAELHGYRWLWIDSCCIDKTSSSELSEAINSMYQWYKGAEVCYAYLADVRDGDDDDLDAPDSAFRTSRWHTRGWTLQELIAPAFLIFLSADWRELGNRAALAGLLQEITGVPFGVLTGEHMPAECSISIRMFWASKRKTTRVEDEAYCLMGLFGVSMPTNYGEGKEAFTRLQYEIMQHDESDMSLFAFGPSVSRDDTVLTFHAQNQVNHPWQYLLADSPREFDYGFGYIPDLGTNAKQQYPPPLDSAVTGPFDIVELPRATVTSYGIKLRLPVYTADSTTIAVVLCTNHNRHFGLFLTPDRGRKDPKRPRYFIGCVYQRPSTTGSATYVARIADLGDDLYNLTFNGTPVRASWRTIYVVPTASSGRSTAPNLILNCNPASRFRVPQWLISRFTTLQFEVDQVRNTDALRVVRILHRSNARIFVSLGSCTEHQEHSPDKPSALWAKVDVFKSLFDMDTFTHDCAEDHLDSESWAARSKVFGDADRKVRLSFTPSSRRSENVVVIHLELGGRVFEEMLREAAVSFPSLAALEIDTLRPTPSDAATSIQPRTLVHIESPSSRSPSSSPAREPHARPPSFPHRSHVTPSDPITPIQPRALAHIASPFSSHPTRQPRARPPPFSHTSRRTPREVIALFTPGFPPRPPSIASLTPSSNSNSTWKPKDPSFPFPPPVTNHRLGIRAVQGKIGDGHVSCPDPPSAARVTPTRMFYSDGAHRNLWRGGRGEGTLNGFPWPSAGRPPMGPWSSSHPPTPPPGNLPNPQSFFSLGLLVVHWMLGGFEAVVGTGSVPLEDTE